MKPTDVQILRIIRRNARANLTTMSKQTGIPVSTIFDRLRVNEGVVIKKFTALLDFSQLGYPVRVNVFVKLRPEHRTHARSYLLAHPQVNNLARINNGYDYSVDGVFKSVKDAEDFIDELERKFAVEEHQMFHVIDDLASEKMFEEEIAEKVNKKRLNI